MPYRVDITSPRPNSSDLLIDLGALDVEPVGSGLAAVMPDHVTPEKLTPALGGVEVTVSPAVGRDNGSVWLISPRPVRIGPDTVALTDSNAFGTGHHPTTALCIEALQEILSLERIDRVLDVGTGSGILALAALILGVPQAVALDIDADALQAASENARLNNLAGRLRFVLGGPDVVGGTWPLVVANVLAAPLIEMAPMLVRRVGPRGRLILSGIPSSLEWEVRKAYEHFGMRHLRSNTRSGWTMLMLQASW